MAAPYGEELRDELVGLLLYGAYPVNDMSARSDLAVMSVSGTNDGLADVADSGRRIRSPWQHSNCWARSKQLLQRTDRSVGSHLETMTQCVARCGGAILDSQLGQDVTHVDPHGAVTQ
jgi:hypothetical protein